MTVKRHTSTRVADDVLLDAARACVLAGGVRRTTLSDVARTAGVSRMTLYRRFPDVRSMLAALMTREFSALLTAATAGVESSAPARERLVTGAVAGVRALSRDPLMRTVLDRDGQLVLPYVVARLGTTQLLAEQVLRAQLVDGHRDGSVRPADPAVQSRAVLLVVQSFVLSMTPATDDVDAERLLGELALLLDGALAPEVPR